MTAIAIDDEPVALEIITAHSQKLPFLELQASFTNAFKAMAYLQQNLVDLIFLDIKMPDINGLDFYQSLPRKPLLIFTTAYSEHAAASYDLDAVDYLLKPITFTRFAKSCNKVLQRLNAAAETQPEAIFIKSGFEQQKVVLREILYLESAGNYVTIHLMDRRKLMARMTMQEVIDLLPEKHFVRTHRSFGVAVKHVQRIERNQVDVAGVGVPLSESYRHALLEVLKNLKP